MVKKLCVSIDEKLLVRIDNYAESRGITRSAALSVLASEQLDQKKAIDTFTDMVALAKNGNLTEA